MDGELLLWIVVFVGGYLAALAWLFWIAFTRGGGGPRDETEK